MKAVLPLAAVAVLLSCDDAPPAPWVNRAPHSPSVSGPPETYVGLPTGFQVTAYDPDGHDLVVYVAWGDGDTTDYGSFVHSGSTVAFEHTWRRTGTFYITGRCYDVYDPRKPLFSEWSNPGRVAVLPP